MPARSPDESSARRPAGWIMAVAIIAVIAAAGYVAVVAVDRDADDSNSASSGEQVIGSVADRRAASAEVLAAQQTSLIRGDRDAFLRTWASDAESQRAAEQMFANLERLDARVTLRSEAPQIDAIRSDGSWDADVVAVWRIPGLWSRAARSPLQYTFDPDGSTGAKVAAVTSVGDAQEPVWLAEALDVRRRDGWTVATGSATDSRRLARLMPWVVAGVDDVIEASRPVLVYAPSNTDAMRAVLGRSASSVEGVAAVTASVDGSLGRTAPVVVVVNPDSWDRLDRSARVLVLAHESTHVLTGAAMVTMPLWLAEGFADYVGVQVAGVPVPVAARVAVQDTRAHGVPSALPGRRAFSASGRELELAYEQSWLVVRGLAQQYGPRATERFYDQVVAAPTELRSILRAELGTSLEQVVRQWRSDLRELADG